MSEFRWYQDAIIYQLHVRSFCDSNGDGIGDFIGLTSKLDYVASLGVTAIWLLPFYPSPLRDEGYDIADYMSVNPAYGTLDDFKTFLDAAHQRGLKVITELVINHTSDQHAWFKRARQAAPGSREREYYVWSDTEDRYSGVRVIFRDFELSNWSWDPIARQYFWHRFYSHQPDLNFDSPDVRAEVKRIFDFWLGIGVDGLRLDAIPYLFEREGTNCESLSETHAYLRELREHINQNFPDRMLLAEANQWPDETAAYFGNGDECHMCFHFPLMPRLFLGLQQENRFPIVDILRQTPTPPESAQWAVFLRNHDELTLEMVSEEDRLFLWTTYANDPQARINMGVRRRLAPLLRNDRRKIELLHGLMLAIGGTPVMYYGDEILMGDNYYLRDRDSVRTPMQWSPDRNAGFSVANPQQLFLPPITDPEFHFQTNNVETHDASPHSFLWWLRRIIRLRRQHPAFGRGSLTFLNPANPRILTFLREHLDEVLLVVFNLSRQSQYVELDLAAFRGRVPRELFGQTDFPMVGELPYLLTLSPHGFYWFELHWPAGASSRTDVSALPEIQLHSTWTELADRSRWNLLEAVLPAHLGRQAWFPGSRARIRTCRISNVMQLPVPNEDEGFLLVIVIADMNDGLSETYQLPLIAARTSRAELIINDRPNAGVTCLRREADRNSPVAKLAKSFGSPTESLGDFRYLGTTLPADCLTASASNDDWVLCDATAETEFWLSCLSLHGGRKVVTPIGLVGWQALSGEWNPAEVTPLCHLARGPVIDAACAVIKGQTFVTLFRRVDAGTHPEEELGQALATTSFGEHLPRELAALRVLPHSSLKPATTLGLIHNYAPYEESMAEHIAAIWSRLCDEFCETPVVPGTTEKAWQLSTEGEATLGSLMARCDLIGQRLGELHLALAGLNDPADIAAEPISVHYRRSIFEAKRAGLSLAVEQVRSQLPSLDDNDRKCWQLFLQHENVLLSRIANVMQIPLTLQRIRSHGAFTLDALLWTGSDIVVLRVGGERGRPLAERRLKRLVVRDLSRVVMSLRELLCNENLTYSVGQNVGVEFVTAACRQRAEGALLAAYRRTVVDESLLPQNDALFETIFSAFRVSTTISALLTAQLNNDRQATRLALKLLCDEVLR